MLWDRVLVQEWKCNADLQQWFEDNVGGVWHVRSGRSGVSIISRLRILKHRIQLQDSKVRFVGCVVQAEWGHLLVGSTHLKCCGSAGSEEDHRRIAEVKTIRNALEDLPDELTKHMVVGGDVNLVGSRDPLDLLLDDLDADGTDLTPAKTLMLGDDAIYTWRDADSVFPPGRLDWLLYSDSIVRVAKCLRLRHSPS